MMGMCDVGRIVGSIALVLAVLVGPFNAFSYGSAMTHLEVTGPYSAAMAAMILRSSLR